MDRTGCAWARQTASDERRGWRMEDGGSRKDDPRFRAILYPSSSILSTAQRATRVSRSVNVALIARASSGGTTDVRHVRPKLRREPSVVGVKTRGIIGPLGETRT